MARRPTVEGWWPIRSPHAFRSATAESDASAVFFFCECGDPSCSARVELSLETYDGVRTRPGCFVVAPGHERPPFSWIVEAGDGYSIVEADGGAYWRLLLDSADD